MLIKWITCRTTSRAAFGFGQRAWAELRRVPGFRGQAGGWSRQTAGVAQIFGFWSDPGSYRAFMAGAHDRIAAAQAGTFGDIRVRVLEQRLAIGRGLPAGFAGASLLRPAHCRVPEHHRDHFVRLRDEAWNPGMCGGVVAGGDEAEFLVLSAWRTAADLQRHLDERLPGRRAAAEPAADLVELEPEWTVPSAAPEGP